MTDDRFPRGHRGARAEAGNTACRAEDRDRPPRAARRAAHDRRRTRCCSRRCRRSPGMERGSRAI